LKLLLYYITARAQFPGDEAAQRRSLLHKIEQAARCGIDYIQLREKDLTVHELERLAAEAVSAVRSNSRRTAGGESSTHLLINSRSDVALAVGADGVHMRAEDISVHEVRELWKVASERSESGGFPIISVACHGDAEVARAAAENADLAIFAPVFEKNGSPGATSTGLEALRQACRYNVPVLALGGVTLETIPACLNCGAAGIAAIRLFQENDVAEIVDRLRA
jgi:thiamine-phosphate pyrophosphorylase